MHLLGSNAFPLPLVPRDNDTQGSVQYRLGVKYCPSMDLIAVFPQVAASDQAIELAGSKSDNDESEDYGESEEEMFVEVFRLNGQKAFAIGIDSRAGSIGIVDVAWRSDGKAFTIATSDNAVRLVNSFTGKITQTFSSIRLQHAADSISPTSPSTKRKSATKVLQSRKRRCMPVAVSYAAQFMSPNEIKDHLAQDREAHGRSLDELQELNVDLKTMLKLKPDMPRDLAVLDVEQCLPKLAVLPANGLGEEDIFSTRPSIDAIFHPGGQTTQATTTDVIVVAHTDAHVHLRIFDSFEIGDIDISQGRHTDHAKTDQIVKIVSHPFYHRLYLLVRPELTTLTSPSRQTRSRQTTDSNAVDLQVVSLSLNFLKNLPWTISVLATKATQLQNLIRYVRQIELQLTREVKTALELPRRFLAALEGELQDQDGEGSTFEVCAFHTMLTGEIRGKFKEWLAEVLGERNLKRWEKAVCDCLDLIRSLTEQNLASAVERIGLVTATLRGLLSAYPSLGYDGELLDGLRDTADIMAILCEDLLKDTNHEMSGFVSFMKWLKLQVEAAALEDTSERLEELRENSDQSDTMKVFKYIQTHLRTASVKKYLNDAPVAVGSLNGGGRSAFDQYKQGRSNGNNEGLISLKSLTSRLEASCASLFLHIARHLQDSIVVERFAELDFAAEGLLDARIVSQTDPPRLQVVGYHPSGKGVLRISTLALDTTREREAMMVKEVPLTGLEEVIDLAIADDYQVVVLGRGGGIVKVVSVSLEQQVQQTLKHEFDGAKDIFTKLGLQPAKLEVNGRKGRRTVTVADDAVSGYAVFDLDSNL